MKNLLALFISLFAFISLPAQDYFWVGDGGNWSDLNHWATSSGGDVLHTSLPSSENDVFFDGLSFSMSSQDVLVDQDSFECRNLTMSGIDFNPTFLTSDYYNQFFIHGNISMTSELTWGIQQNHMVGEEHSTIQIENAFMAGSLILSPIDSTAKFELLADIDSEQISLVNGQFDSKGYQLYLREIRVGNAQKEGSAFFNFNDSEVRSSRFVVFNFGEIDAGTSNITIYDGPGNSSNLFFGGGNNFHHVSFEGEIDRIKDNNQYVQFTALPASNLTLEPGEVQTAEQFVFKGTGSSPISLSSRKEGEVAMLEQKEGHIDGNYLILKDNSAIGGADFNAFNSIDNGNVSGWNVEVTAPEDYFWVGNSGKWSELEHWAKTSGGSDFHIELPSAIDNVYFDENSVTDEAAVVDIDLESILIGDFSLEGLKEGSQLNVINGKIILFGDVVFDKNLDLNFKEVEFAGDSTQSLTSNGSKWGFSSVLKFRGSGSIELLDEISADEISISSGEFNANGNAVRTTGPLKLNTLNSPVINLDESNIIVQSWIPSGADVNVSLENTDITCYFIFYGRGFQYDKVTFGGRNWVYGPFFTDSLEFYPGSEILILPGDTIKFNKVSAVGTETDTITIASREPGEVGYLYCEQGNVNGSYLKIRDNHAIGGATFIAKNSDIDEESVSGWSSVVSAVENPLEKTIRCFPNPAQDKFSISLDGPHLIEEIKIVDLYGRLISTFSVSRNLETLNVDTSEWSEGIYVVFSNKGKWSRKVVITRK